MNNNVNHCYPLRNRNQGDLERLLVAPNDRNKCPFCQRLSEIHDDGKYECEWCSTTYWQYEGEGPCKIKCYRFRCHAELDFREDGKYECEECELRFLQPIGEEEPMFGSLECSQCGLDFDYNPYNTYWECGSCNITIHAYQPHYGPF